MSIRPLCSNPEPVFCRRLTAEGRGAQTVYRDRSTGRIVTKDEFVESRKTNKKEKTKEELEEEQYLVWRGGLAQQKAAQERAERMAREVGGAGVVCGHGGTELMKVSWRMVPQWCLPSPARPTMVITRVS